jgi:hypothetical protein
MAEIYSYFFLSPFPVMYFFVLADKPTFNYGKFEICIPCMSDAVVMAPSVLQLLIRSVPCAACFFVLCAGVLSPRPDFPYYDIELLRPTTILPPPNLWSAQACE